MTFLLQETKSGYHNTQQSTSGSTSQEFLASSRTLWLPLAGLEWRWGLNWPGAISSGDETKPTHDQRSIKPQEFWVLEGFLLDLNTQTDTSRRGWSLHLASSTLYSRIKPDLSCNDPAPPDEQSEHLYWLNTQIKQHVSMVQRSNMCKKDFLFELHPRQDNKTLTGRQFYTDISQFGRRKVGAGGCQEHSKPGSR